jgi:mannose/cellobiose epimerase-like protein (N-acyl-D-glucosamine 2-epimerase family)
LSRTVPPISGAQCGRDEQSRTKSAYGLQWNTFRIVRPEEDRATFRRQWTFIEAHMLDPVHGGWYMDTARDGSPGGDTRKATQWKACYHTNRALINVSTMLGRIEKPAPMD